MIYKSLSFLERAGKPGGGKGILVNEERTGCLATMLQPKVVYRISSYESNSMKSCNPHSGINETDIAKTLDVMGDNPACNQGGDIVVEQILR